MDVYFNEYEFKRRVDKALERVKTILDNTRQPAYPTDVHHEYEDKYLLAEFLGNSTLASHVASLDYLGLSEAPFKQAKEWCDKQKKSVSLRLKAEEECKFLRKEKRNVESDTKHVSKGLLGKFESFTVTKVREYIWQFTVKWELIVYPGVEAEKGIVLQSHTGSVEIKTSVKGVAPKPANLVRPNIDINITWFIQNIDDTRTPVFNIDRKSKETRTPRRNPQVEKALSFLKDFHNWAINVGAYFTGTVFPAQLNHGLDLSSINDDSIFVPVLPLFESSSSLSSSSSSRNIGASMELGGKTLVHSSSSPSVPSSSSSSSKIPTVYINSFLAEQTRSLEEKRKELAKIFTVPTTIITLTEAQLILTLIHTRHVSEAFSQGVDYIENMLHEQLVAAIGKTVSPSDFASYLNFHYRKIFRASYRPQPFSYAIRRPDHYPEGVLSIEAHLDSGGVSSPVQTIVSHSIARQAMKFPINASTSISFWGDRYLHGYVSHQFSGDSGVELSLCARARQFSSFILMIGTIISADQFDPKYAIIIQNKDDLKIPLLLETMPTPKEFKDAIESLSPEQQRFCKAFRSMQLESTLFGVCVVQIKPQLEKLLNLPDDSLTKEIQLTQDLLTMFIKYQIPSDLLSYDGRSENSAEVKVEQVKEYVKRMNRMLDESKEAQLQEARLQQQHRIAENDYLVHKNSLSSAGLYDEDSGYRETTKRKVKKPMMKEKEKSKEMKDKSSSAKKRSASPKSGSAQPQPQRQQQQQQQQQPEQPQKPQQETNVDNQQKEQQVKELVESFEEGEDSTEVVDYTKVPYELERKFEELDENNALRPTIITTSSSWSKTHFKSLLSDAESHQVTPDEQEKERNKAFDLLDALTKSGALSVDYASLHVVIASTHCFDKSIIDTLVQDNVNPIEKIENSTLIVASTIHQTTPVEMIAVDHVERIGQTCPLLMEGKSERDLIEMS